MTKELIGKEILVLGVDPQSWFEQPPDKYTSLSSFNEKMDNFISELDSLTKQTLSQSTSVPFSSQLQESLVIDPISSPVKPHRLLESGSVLTRDFRSLQAVTEGIAALAKLCDCSIPEAVHSFHFCSGNILRAKQLLDGKGGTPWTAKEDRLLLSHSLGNYCTLLKYRTPDDLKRRLDYFAIEDA